MNELLEKIYENVIRQEDDTLDMENVSMTVWKNTYHIMMIFPKRIRNV